MPRRKYSEKFANRPGGQLDTMRQAAVPLGRSAAPLHRDRSLTPDGMDYSTKIRSHIQPAKNLNPYSNKEPRGEKTISTCAARPSTSSNYTIPRKVADSGPPRNPNRPIMSYRAPAGRVEKRNPSRDFDSRPAKIAREERNPSADFDHNRPCNPGHVRKTLSAGRDRRTSFSENIPESPDRRPADVHHHQPVHRVQPQRKSPVLAKKISFPGTRGDEAAPGTSRRSAENNEHDTPPIKKNTASSIAYFSIVRPQPNATAASTRKAEPAKNSVAPAPQERRLFYPINSCKTIRETLAKNAAANVCVKRKGSPSPPTYNSPIAEDQYINKKDKTVVKKNGGSQERSGGSNKKTKIDKEKEVKKVSEDGESQEKIVLLRNIKKELEEEEDRERIRKEKAVREERKRIARVMLADYFSLEIANKCMLNVLVRINKIRQRYRPRTKNIFTKVRFRLDKKLRQIRMANALRPKKPAAAPTSPSTTETLEKEAQEVSSPSKTAEKEQPAAETVQKEKTVPPSAPKEPLPPKSVDKEQPVPPSVPKEKAVAPIAPAPPTSKEMPNVEKEKPAPWVPLIVQQCRELKKKRGILGKVPPPKSSLPPIRCPPLPPLKCPPLPPLKCPPIPPARPQAPKEVPKPASPALRPMQVVPPHQVEPTEEVRKKTDDGATASKRSNITSATSSSAIFPVIRPHTTTAARTTKRAEPANKSTAYCNASFSIVRPQPTTAAPMTKKAEPAKKSVAPERQKIRLVYPISSCKTIRESLAKNAVAKVCVKSEEAGSPNSRTIEVQTDPCDDFGDYNVPETTKWDDYEDEVFIIKEVPARRSQ